MAKEVFNGLGKLCLALGVDDPNTVTRVVVDIRAGHHPMLYVERTGDARKILAALSEPGIELKREEYDGLSDAPVITAEGNVSGGQFAWGNGNVTQSKNG